MTPSKQCCKSGCDSEAVGFVGKFGEKWTIGPPLAPPPKLPISSSYCMEHKEWVELALAAL
jgi:hypothetical protein